MKRMLIVDLSLKFDTPLRGVKREKTFKLTEYLEEHITDEFEFYLRDNTSPFLTE